MPTDNLIQPPPPAATLVPLKPEWLRVDQAIHVYGLSRSMLYELMAAGTIKSAVLKKRGNIRGIRLLSSGSLDAYLEGAVVGSEKLAA